MCEKCQYSGFFWSILSRIRTEYAEIRSISPYSVQMQENTDQKKNSKNELFSSSEDCRFKTIWAITLS